MSYYTGQGDYYSGKGDPGLFSFIGKALKTVGGLVPGVGGIMKTVGGFLDRPSAPAAPAFQPYGGGMVNLMAPQGVPTPGLMGMAQRAVPGGASGYQGCTPGYHLDKTTKTKCVRNRSMNVANPKALRRAIRREAGFVTLAKQALKGSGYTFKRTSSPKKRSRRR